MKIVGNKFRPAGAQAVFNQLAVGDEVFLELEPTNEHDPFAVKVLARGNHIGYVPRDASAVVHALGVDGVRARCSLVGKTERLMDVEYIAKVAKGQA